ncbi:hypothetical protein GCM10008986_16430 [Salinibacillus aidingensis]|uniref:Helix-turn-helix domain-containing protein n=1 Tax=Salinibacillus aidingensis TaxID=237684 RepID=A0ABN1B698_9BACI
MPVYIAHDERNLDWWPDELERFRNLWNEGKSIFEMARLLKRPQVEIAIIILDQAEEGFIEQREGGIFGNDFKR